jgi:hypothetical protein
MQLTACNHMCVTMYMPTGVRLDSRSCEVLELVLSRVQMLTLDLQRTNLEDEVSDDGALCVLPPSPIDQCSASTLCPVGQHHICPRWEGPVFSVLFSCLPCRSISLL